MQSRSVYCWDMCHPCPCATSLNSAAECVPYVMPLFKNRARNHQSFNAFHFINFTSRASALNLSPIYLYYKFCFLSDTYRMVDWHQNNSQTTFHEEESSLLGGWFRRWIYTMLKWLPDSINFKVLITHEWLVNSPREFNIFQPLECYTIELDGFSQIQCFTLKGHKSYLIALGGVIGVFSFPAKCCIYWVCDMPLQGITIQSN